jgi:hypothetical protein
VFYIALQDEKGPLLERPFCFRSISVFQPMRSVGSRLGSLATRARAGPADRLAWPPHARGLAARLARVVAAKPEELRRSELIEARD